MVEYFSQFSIIKKNKSLMPVEVPMVSSPTRMKNAEKSNL